MSQDWDENEALRASLREHMAEIQRLNECLTWEQHRTEHVGTHGPGCAEWGPKHYECLLRAHKALKERIDRSADTGKTSDVPETNFGDMSQVFDSTEDDHIRDATKMVASVREDRTVEATIKDFLTVEPVATSQESRQVEPVAWWNKKYDSVMLMTRLSPQLGGMEGIKSSPAYAAKQLVPLYTAPPKREPLTESFLEELAEKHVTHCYFDTLTYARAIERAHAIGGGE